MKNRLPISYSTGVVMKNQSSYLCSNSCPSFMDGVQGGVRSSWNVRIHDPQAISSLPNYTSATTLVHSTRRATVTTTQPAWGRGAHVVTTPPRTCNTLQPSGVRPQEDETLYGYRPHEGAVRRVILIVEEWVGKRLRTRGVVSQGRRMARVKQVRVSICWLILSTRRVCRCDGDHDVFNAVSEVSTTIHNVHYLHRSKVAARAERVFGLHTCDSRTLRESSLLSNEFFPPFDFLKSAV